MTARQEIAASRNFNPADGRCGCRLGENLVTASFLRRSFRKGEAGSANRAAPTTNEEGTSKTVRVKTQIASFHTAWVETRNAHREQLSSAVPQDRTCRAEVKRISPGNEAGTRPFAPSLPSALTVPSSPNYQVRPSSS